MFCGLATSALTLFLARCGIGAGEAVMNPSAVSLIGDRYPRKAVVGALSLYSIGVVGGGGLAIALGGQLIAYFTSLGRIDFLGFDDVPVWRIVFIAVGAPGLLLAVLVHFTIDDPERRTGGKAASSENQSALRPEESWRDVAAWIWRRRKVYGPLFAGLVAYGFYNYSVLGWYPVMFARTFGATTGEISIWYGSAYLIGGIAGALSAGPLEKRLRKRGYSDAPALILLVSVAIAAVPAVAGPLMPDFHLAVACFVVGIFMAALQTSMAFSAFVLITPADRRGIVVAIYVMVMNLTGGSFGTVVIGLLSDHVFGPANVAYSLSLMGGVALPLSALCYASLRPHYRKAATAEDARLTNLAGLAGAN
jgi:MFS family permease